MAKHEFLSDDWIAAARALHAQHASDGTSGTALATSVRMNLVVEDVPFGTERLDAHLDTSTGAVAIDLGHLEGADVVVSLDYATAKAILVDGDAQAGMQAFLAGRIRVDGDLTKLLAFQSGAPGTGQLAVAAALQAITA